MAALALVLWQGAASRPLYLYAHGKGPCNVKAPGGACRLSDREIKRLDDIVDAHLHHTITLEDIAQALGVGRCGPLFGIVQGLSASFKTSRRGEAYLMLALGGRCRLAAQQNAPRDDGPGGPPAASTDAKETSDEHDPRGG